jgi:hypothetical protein
VARLSGRSYKGRAPGVHGLKLANGFDLADTAPGRQQAARWMMKLS